jgi:hypothetical protein
MSGESRAVAADETLETLTKARSMLVILLATCKQTLLVLDAVANVLDTDMTEDLRVMIARSEGELAVMDDRIASLRK